MGNAVHYSAYLCNTLFQSRGLDFQQLYESFQLVVVSLPQYKLRGVHVSRQHHLMAIPATPAFAHMPSYKASCTNARALHDTLVPLETPWAMHCPACACTDSCKQHYGSWQASPEVVEDVAEVHPIPVNEHGAWVPWITAFCVRGWHVRAAPVAVTMHSCKCL